MKNYKQFLALSFISSFALMSVNVLGLSSNKAKPVGIHAGVFYGVQNYQDSSLLVKTLQDFIQKADSEKYTEIIPYYDSNFVSYRLVDSGPFIKMTYSQMISFWKMQATRQPSSTGFNHKAIINQSTNINNIEILGNVAYVLLTRVKDLGNGP